MLQTPIADTRVINDPTWGVNSNFGTDGSLGVYRARDRSLLQFAIPLGATINSAGLTLTATDLYDGNPGGEAMNIYRLTGAWTEYGVTWNTQPGFDGTIQASSTANPGTGQTITWDITALAGQWASGTTANNGLILINSGASNGLHFASKENGTLSYRPYLAMNFTTPGAAPAGANVWSGGDGVWTDANRWLDGVTPATWADGKDAVFGTGADTAGTVTLSGAVTPRTLWFQAAASGSYTVSGGTLDLGGNMRIIDTAADATVASSITNGGIFKQGAGKLVLAGQNNFNGGLMINGGVVEAARSFQDHGIHTLGTGPLTINAGGTLRSTAQWSTSSEWNGGTTVGAITINAGGTWAIEAVGQSVYNGLNLNGGSVTASVSNADWGALHLKSNVTAGGNAVSSIGADTALNWGKTITVDAGSQLNYSGVIHNQITTDGAITKAGAGTLVLSGNNSYSGGTSVNGGVLRLDHTGALGAGGLSMSGGTTLQLRADGDAAFSGGDNLGGLGGASITMDVNQLTGGNFNKTLSFASGGFNTYLTTINVTGGNGYSLALGRINEGFNGALTLNAVSARLTIGGIGVNSAVSSLNVGGDADTAITGAIFTGGGVTKSGNGMLTLSGTSNYGGVTTLEGGILNAATFSDYGVDGSLGNRASDGMDVGLLFRGGTLQYTGSTPQSTNRGIRISTTGGAAIDASGSDPSATLRFTAASSTNFFENPGDRTLTLTGTNTGDNTFAMAIGEAGGVTSVVKNGPGKWILTANNSYSGGTRVEGGILLVHGVQTAGLITVSSATFGGAGEVGDVEVGADGRLAPGDTARGDNWLQMAELSLLDSTGRLNFELGAPDVSGSALAANDLIIALRLSDYTRGQVNVIPLAGFASASPGSKWPLIQLTGGTVPADHELVLDPALAGQYTLQSQEGDNVLYLVAVPEAGPAGLVGLALLILRLFHRK